jgi:hypothetical protein
LGLEGAPDHASADCAGGETKTGDQRVASRHQALLRRLGEGSGKTIAECGVHPLGAGPRAGEARGGGDRLFLFGVSPTQLQAATPE